MNGVRIAAFLLLLMSGAVFADTKQPNIVFILADDLGWSDTTLYGTTRYFETAHNLHNRVNDPKATQALIRLWLEVDSYMRDANDQAPVVGKSVLLPGPRDDKIQPVVLEVGLPDPT